MNSQESERQSFEAEMRRRGVPVTRVPGGGYKWHSAAHAWDLWKAARASLPSAAASGEASAVQEAEHYRMLFNATKLGHEQAFAECQSLSGLLRRALGQLGKWQRKYGEHSPAWLPPDGDVRLAEDIDAALGNSPAPTPAVEGLTADEVDAYFLRFMEERPGELSVTQLPALRAFFATRPAATVPMASSAVMASEDHVEDEVCVGRCGICDEASSAGEPVAEPALIEASNRGYAQGLADGKAIAPPAASLREQEPLSDARIFEIYQRSAVFQGTEKTIAFARSVIAEYEGNPHRDNSWWLGWNAAIRSNGPALKKCHEWIEEALSYVGSPSWSPSMEEEGRKLIGSIDRDAQRLGREKDGAS